MVQQQVPSNIKPVRSKWNCERHFDVWSDEQLTGLKINFMSIHMVVMQLLRLQTVRHIA